MHALDIERPDDLVTWLRETGRIPRGESPEVRVLTGGVSNRTVLVSRPRGSAWVLKQALDKLRVAVDWFSSPERIHREALGIRWLSTLAPPNSIPPLVFEDEQQHLLAMRAVPSPHANWKDMLLAGNVDGDHVRQFGMLLGSIHRGSLLAGACLSDVFADRQFFESLRMEPFYDYTAEQVPRARTFLRALALETRGMRQALVHGDYSPKNILIRGHQLVLLDHEVIHWGDPMFDVGFALSHLLSKAHHLVRQREAFAGASVLFWECYRFAACPCLASPEQQSRAVRHAIGCVLARGAGRSPMGYLDQGARNRQVQAATTLLRQVPETVVELVDRFMGELGGPAG